MLLKMFIFNLRIYGGTLTQVFLLTNLLFLGTVESDRRIIQIQHEHRRGVTKIDE